MAEPLSKLAEKCKSCPKSKKCDHKRMELCVLADLPKQNLANATQDILIDAEMPVLREEIKSPLSPFRYKDELEKALNDFHFGNRFMNGAQKVGEAVNLAEAKEKYYPTYKYALVDAKSNKPHSLYVDRKTAEEERRDLWKCYSAVLIVIDLSEVEK